MKFLVVGGAGYVGGGIVDKLSQEHEVTVYDSFIKIFNKIFNAF